LASNSFVARAEFRRSVSDASFIPIGNNGRMSNPYEEQQPQTQQSPMPYGQQYGAPPQEHPQGTLILVFGILGIFITIFAPIAWYMGNKAKREIQASGIQYSNEQNVSIGRMLGKIFTIIALISIAISIIITIIVVAVGVSQSGG
jgi:hypothetical protein